MRRKVNHVVFGFFLLTFDKKHVGRVVPCAARQVNVGHGKVESSDGEGTPKTNGSWENTMIGHLAGSFLP